MPVKNHESFRCDCVIYRSLHICGLLAFFSFSFCLFNYFDHGYFIVFMKKWHQKADIRNILKCNYDSLFSETNLLCMEFSVVIRICPREKVGDHYNAIFY